MLFHRIQQRELSIYTYIIGDEHTMTCTIVDPTLDLDPILRVVNHKGYKIEAIIETHVHLDYISGAKKLKEALDNKPTIYASICGGPDWKVAYADKELKNGDSVTVGSFRFEAIHTPGPTPEHLVFKIFHDENLIGLLTGDLVLNGGVGRPDLIRGESDTLAHELYHSLFHTLKPLSDDLPIFPNHGAATLLGKVSKLIQESNLGDERYDLFNDTPEQEWVDDILMNLPSTPFAFERIKNINLTGSMPSLSEKPFIIDTRDPVSFAAGHNKGAVNIPWCPSFLIWTLMMAPHAPLRIIPPVKAPFEFVKQIFSLVGFNDVIAIDLKKEETLEFLEEPQNYQLIDVRTPYEISEHPYNDTIRMELGEFPEKAKSLNPEQPFMPVCAAGTRAMIAASYLKSLGFKKVAAKR